MCVCVCVHVCVYECVRACVHVCVFVRVLDLCRRSVHDLASLIRMLFFLLIPILFLPLTPCYTCRRSVHGLLSLIPMLFFPCPVYRSPRAVSPIVSSVPLPGRGAGVCRSPSLGPPEDRFERVDVQFEEGAEVSLISLEGGAHGSLGSPWTISGFVQLISAAPALSMEPNHPTSIPHPHMSQWVSRRRNGGSF